MKGKQTTPLVKTSFEARVKQRLDRGEIIPAKHSPLHIRPLKKVSGALERFLKERE